MTSELPPASRQQAVNLETDSRAQTGRIARSTLLLFFAFGAAKAISLVQTVIILRTVGLSTEWDAYVSANRAPELIFTLIAGGALAYAFIPVFGGQLAQGDENGAWRTASNVINTIFAVTLLASLVVFIFAPWLVSTLIASGFDAITQAQTVSAMRILLIGTMIFAVSGIVSGILHSYQHFLLPALAPILYDVGILIGVIFLLGPFGVNGVAWGTVLGAALHLGIQIPGLVRYGARWTPRFGWNNPQLWRVIRLMLPRVAGLGVFQVTFIMMNNIASQLGPASVSSWDWGYRIMQIPQTLIGTAMGIVIFPTLAALSELGDEQGKRGALSGALRFILIGTIPSAVGLIMVGRPLIALLEGGVFTPEQGDMVYNTLRFFALAIIVQSVNELAPRSFYADKDTVTPLWAAIAGAGLNFVLALVFTGILTPRFPTLDALNIGIGGLALSYSLGIALETSILLAILRRRWHWRQDNALVSTLTKTLIASGVMAVALFALSRGWEIAGLANQGRLLTLVEIGMLTLSGALVFAGVATALRMREIWDILGMLFNRQRIKEAVAA